MIGLGTCSPRIALPAVLLVGALICCSLGNPASAQNSPLIGKPCPEINVSHSLQGEAWKREDLIGSIVVLDLFQLG